MDSSVVFASWRHWASHAFFGLLQSTTQMASRAVEPFCAAHDWVSSGMPKHVLSPKIAPSHRGSGPSSNTCFLWPNRVYNPSNTPFLAPIRVLRPNGISIGSAFFAGLTILWQDRPTDRATRSVTIGRIYLRSTAMRTFCTWQGTVTDLGHAMPCHEVCYCVLSLK